MLVTRFTLWKCWTYFTSFSVFVKGRHLLDAVLNTIEVAEEGQWSRRRWTFILGFLGFSLSTKRFWGCLEQIDKGMFEIVKLSISINGMPKGKFGAFRELSTFVFLIYCGDRVKELWDSRISGSSLGLCFNCFHRPQSFFHSVRLEGCCNLGSLFL